MALVCISPSHHALHRPAIGALVHAFTMEILNFEWRVVDFDGYYHLTMAPAADCP